MLALLLVLTQAAIARGDLQKLSRFSGQLSIEVRGEGRGNLLPPPALRELWRWPGLVTLQLRLPLTALEARQLRSLRRLAVRAPRRDRSLALLGPALVRVTTAELTAPALDCRDAGSPAGPDGEAVLLEDGVTACALAWIERRAVLHAEPPEK